MIKPDFKKIKQGLILTGYLFFSIFVFFGWYSMFKNWSKTPPMQDSEAKYVIMKNDMAQLLAQGGRLVRSHTSSKFNNKSLIHSVADEEGNTQLASKYRTILLSKAWMQIEETPRLDVFCKEGILMEISSIIRLSDAVVEYSLMMTFNADSVEKCAPFSPFKPSVSPDSASPKTTPKYPSLP